MKGIRNWHHSAVATASAVVVGLAGVLLFVRFQAPHRPDPIAPAPAAAVRSGPANAANTGNTGNTGNGVSGKGIPTAPGPEYSYSESAPPQHPDAPTANLRKVADNLRVRNYSVSFAVTLPRGLGLTNRVDVGVHFLDPHDTKTDQLITQTYDNAKGNRIFTNLPEGKGYQRRAEVVTTLRESAPGGTNTQYTVRNEVDLEPLYDVALGPLSITLGYPECDWDGGSEAHMYWRWPNGRPGDSWVEISAGETSAYRTFAINFRQVGHSAQLGVPTFSFHEDEGRLNGFFDPPAPRPPDKLTRALLPGKTQTVKFFMQADNDYNCGASFSYDLTITLYQHPYL